MEDKNKFVDAFVEAAKENDENKMKELSEQAGEVDVTDRVALLEDIVTKLKETGANPEVEAGLAATLQLVKTAIEAKEDSAGEEGKEDNAEPEEATEEVAADTSTVETASTAEDSTASAEKTEGEAPAEEEKAEKTEQ